MPKNVRIIALFFAALFSFASLPACKKAEDKETGPRIAYLADLDSLGSDSSEQVDEAIAEAKKQNTFVFTVYHSKDESELVKNAKDALAKNELVFGTSYSANKAIMDNVSADSDTIGVTINSYEGNENVVSINMASEEAAFFAGVIAAKETQSGAVAYLGGYDNSYSEPKMTGFTAGVKTVNDKIKVFNEYVLSYNSPSRAIEIISSLKDKEVDVIYADCGASILGVEEVGGIKVICSDSYQLESVHTIAYLKTYLKPIVIEMVNWFLEENLKASAEARPIGIGSNVFEYVWNEDRGLPETKDEYDKYTLLFHNFPTEVPKNKQELAEFNPDSIRGMQYLDEEDTSIPYGEDEEDDAPPDSE